jgi:hypothetical protein
MMNINKRNFALLLCSGLGIVLISLFSSHIVPLYDGVGFPDEPYRYVNSSSQTLSPSPASAIANIDQGTNADDFNMVSREQGPQISIYIFQHSLKGPASPAKIPIEASPQDAATTKTPIGKIVGNFYRFTEVGGNKLSFSKTLKRPGYIDLRLPQDIPQGADIMYRSQPTSSWQKVATTRVGSDVYEANLVGFGDYGLVHTNNIKTGNDSGQPQSKRIVILIGLAIFFAITTTILVFIRLKLARPKNKKK